MIAISCITLIFLMFSLYFYAQIPFTVSFLLVSMLSVCTFVGVEKSLGFIVFLLAVINFIIFNRVIYSKKTVLIFLIICLILVPTIFISILNGADINKNFLKLFQIIVICISLFFLSKYGILLSAKMKVKYTIVFLITNVFFGLAAHILYNPYDLGLIRFSGIFFDSNYFALHSLVIFYLLDNIKGHSFLKTMIAIFILSSLSASVIFIFLSYFLMKKFLFKAFFSAKAFFLVTLASTSVYIWLMYLLKELTNNSFESQFLVYKIASLTHRLDAQFQAIDLILSNNALFQGLGSGRNIELTGLALHHSFLQMIFSHGLMFFIVFNLVLSLVIKSTSFAIQGDKNKYFAILYALLIGCFVLDPIVTLFFHLVLFFSYEKKELIKINHIVNTKNMRFYGFSAQVHKKL
jgi:hypothetical protein